VAAPLSGDLSHTIAAGTFIPVELRDTLDSSYPRPQFMQGVVAFDVKGPDGRTALPAGSAVTIFVREMGRTGSISKVVIDLDGVYLHGSQYSLTGSNDPATLTFTEDAGGGPAHSSVHLEYGRQLDFKLGTAVQLE
jgi:hypothetical protein